MPVELFADNAATTLTSSPSSGATSFSVSSSPGFPAAVSGVSQFRVIIGTEIVTVTNVSGTTWTCTALAASHTSGDAVTHVVTASALGNLGAGGGDYFRSGFYSHGMQVLSTGTLLMSQDRLYARPFAVPVRRAFDRIGVNVTTAGGAGCVLRMGIYADGGGLAGTLILDAGTVAATTTGAKEITITQTLDAGNYWLAVVSQGSATAQVTSYQSQPGMFGPWAQVAAGANPPDGIGFPVPYKSSVSGALPSPFGTLSSASNTIPAVCMRAA